MAVEIKYFSSGNRAASVGLYMAMQQERWLLFSQAILNVAISPRTPYMY